MRWNIQQLRRTDGRARPRTAPELDSDYFYWEKKLILRLRLDTPTGGFW